jgi:large subunit ribosomal protein L22
MATADTNNIHAYGQNIGISAQKVRLVADMVRGMDVNQAYAMLKFVPRQASKSISKVLASAMANAEENYGVSRDALYVYRIQIDEGPTRRWRKFGARGRFKPWLRRTSHITITLREREA